MADKSRVVIIVLTVLVILLALVLVYAFVVQPSIDDYNVQKQSEGAQIAVSEILRVVAQCQTFPLNVGEGQTINLVALECLQAPVQQPAQ